MAKKRKYTPEAWQTTKANDHFTPIYDSLMLSEPFQSLTATQKYMLIILHSRYRGDFTAGRTVECRHATFKKYGVRDSHTISKGIKALERAGFIEVERQGFHTKSKTGGELYRLPTKYRFSSRWQQHNE